MSKYNMISIKKKGCENSKNGSEGERERIREVRKVKGKKRKKRWIPDAGEGLTRSKVEEGS